MSYHVINHPMAGLGDPTVPSAFNSKGKFAVCALPTVDPKNQDGLKPYSPSFNLLKDLGYNVSNMAEAEKSVMAFVKRVTGGYNIPPNPWFCETLLQTWKDRFAPDLSTGPVQMVDPALLANTGQPYTPLLGPDQQKPPWMLGRGACPPPMVGAPPNCKVPLSRGGGCPTGMVGKPPWCKFSSGTLDPTIQAGGPAKSHVCEPPFVGTFPNCVLPEGAPPVDWYGENACPPGYVGTKPDCKLAEGWQEVKPEPKRCPPGTRLGPDGLTCVADEQAARDQTSIQAAASAAKTGFIVAGVVGILGIAAVVGGVAYVSRRK